MTSGDRPRDPHLRTALRHAPDVDVQPPAALDAHILRMARDASSSASLKRVSPSAGPAGWHGAWRAVLGALDAWRSPAPAAALGALALGTVAVALWGPGAPVPEALPERSSNEQPAGSERAKAATPDPAPTAEREAPRDAAPPPQRAAARQAPGESVAPAPVATARLDATPVPARPAPDSAPSETSSAPTAAARVAVSAEEPASPVATWRSAERSEAPRGGVPWAHPVDGRPGRLLVVEPAAAPAASTLAPAPAVVWWVPESGPAWRREVPAEQAREWRERRATGPWPPAREHAAAASGVAPVPPSAPAPARR